MSIENYLTNKKRQKALESGELKDIILSTTETLTEQIMGELKPKILKEVEDKVNSTIYDLTKNVKKGDTGKKGDSITGPQGEQGPAGKSIIGQAGPQGLEGKSIKGEPGNNGKDGSPDTPDEIATKLNTLKEKVNIKVIKGLEDIIRLLQRQIREAKKSGGSSGGGGMGNVLHERFTTSSATATVTLKNKVAADSNAIWVYYNGQQIQKDTHYTISGTVITLLETLADNTHINVVYIRT